MKNPKKIMFVLILPAFLLLQSCFHKSDSNGSGNTLQAIMSTGFYFYYLDAGYNEYQYSQITLVDGKIVETDYNWNTTTKTWVAEVPDDPSQDVQVDESQVLMYKANAWSVDVDRWSSADEEEGTWNSNGEFVSPAPLDFRAIGLGASTDISGSNILATDANLTGSVGPAAVFKAASMGYTPVLRALYEIYYFNLGYRYCDELTGVMDAQGNLVCTQPFSESSEYLSDYSSKAVSLEQYRSSYNSLENSTYYRNYSFYFEAGTQNLIIYQVYSSETGEMLPTPVLMAEKGTWTEMDLGGHKIMELTMPDLPNDFIDNTLRKEVYIEYNGAVYNGNHMLPGVHNQEMGPEDALYPWLNEPAMTSILDAFLPPPAGKPPALKSSRKKKPERRSGPRWYEVLFNN